MLYRLEGIVIRSMDYGENNKIINVLTNTNGKVGILIRGAKKARSRHASLAQPFTYAEFTFFRTSGLGTLNHGEILASNHLLREQLELTAYASYAAELTDRAMQEEDTSSFLFEQLKAYLSGLVEGKDPQIVSHLYEMRVLDMSGYAPVLDHCVECGGEETPFRISAAAGGVLCRRCGHKDPQGIVLSEAAYKLLRLFVRMDLRRLGSIQVKPETKQELKKVMRMLMDLHIGIPLKSRGFLDQLDKYSL